VTRASIYIFFCSFCLQALSRAQDTSTYDMKFLRAKITDTSAMKSILVLFQVTTKEEKDFPPVISMRLNYTLCIASDRHEVISTTLGKKDSKAKIIIFGNNVKAKDKYVYNLIKDKIDTTYKRDYWILAFFFRNASKDIVQKMDLTYGLWEKNNPDMRVEKKYEFEVER